MIESMRAGEASLTNDNDDQQQPPSQGSAPPSVASLPATVASSPSQPQGTPVNGEAQIVKMLHEYCQFSCDVAIFQIVKFPFFLRF